MTISRISGDYAAEDLLNFIVAQEHADLIDDYLDPGADPLDRTDRTDVCPGYVLKVGDDVSIFGAFVRRVSAPAGGWANFMTCYYDTVNKGIVRESYSIDTITDRAPADPEEAPGTNAPEDPFSLANPVTP